MSWLKEMLVPWLLPDKDYTDQVLENQERMFTANWDLYRLGPPRLRQIRMTRNGGSG